MMQTEFSELAARSWYSFMHAASSPEDMVEEAYRLGLKSIALVDRMGLYGVVPFLKQCDKLGIHGVIGAELIFEDGDCLLALCENQQGYRNLSRILTLAAARSAKGEARVQRQEFCSLHSHMIFLLAPRDSHAWHFVKNSSHKLLNNLRQWQMDLPPDKAFILVTSHLQEGDAVANQQLKHLGETLGMKLIPSNQPCYANRERADVLDVLTCIRERKTLKEAQSLRPINHERYVKSSDDLQDLLPECDWELSTKLARKCQVRLDFGNVRIPNFETPDRSSHDDYLRRLCEEALPRYYPVVDTSVRQRLEEELHLIQEKHLSGYFLVVWDLVCAAKEKGILCQGRGSAANSMVAYILGIMPVDPLKYNLLFGRFLNEETSSAPDIDLDFASAPNTGFPDRESVIQYVYQKYGAEHTAMVCTFVTFQTRMAIREAGLVFGMPEEIVERMARMSGQYASRSNSEIQTDSLRQWHESPIWKPYLNMIKKLRDVPRHVSIHVGGMLVAARPLWEIVPLEPATMQGRVVCQWDKDMVDDAGLIKIDILGLRMLSVIQDVRKMVEKERGSPLDLTHDISRDDARVYAEICAADTVGLFQVESRAQMQSLPRTRPQNFNELGIQVALIRPGPLQGNMVNPYIERKQGREAITYMHPLLEPVLAETLGVILFQEQVLKVAIVIGNFTPGQADRLRRAMSRKRSRREMQALEEDFRAGARANGVDDETSDRIFQTLEGFALYGFCKSHALAFANLTYLSAWFRTHYPAAYLAAMLNHQPMGFYSPEVLVQDGRNRGIPVLPPCVVRSHVHCQTEEADGKIGVRMGLNQVNDLGLEAAGIIVDARVQKSFGSFQDFSLRTKLNVGQMEKLIRCGALDCFLQDRRRLLWELWASHKRIKETTAHEKPLVQDIQAPILPLQNDWDKLHDEIRFMGAGIKHHPVELLRKQMRQPLTDSRRFLEASSGNRLLILGLTVIRQRPPTAKGFAFLTLEDEFGMINLIFTPAVYERYREEFRLCPLLLVRGIKQERDGVHNLKVTWVAGVSPKTGEGNRRKVLIPQSIVS